MAPGGGTFPAPAQPLLRGALPSHGQASVPLGLVTSAGLAVASPYLRGPQISALLFPEAPAEWPQAQHRPQTRSSTGLADRPLSTGGLSGASLQKPAGRHRLFH